MNMEPRGSGRLWIALSVLAVLVLLAWKTMEPGKLQYVTWLLLGFFAFRVVLTAMAARYSKSEAVKQPGREAPGGKGEEFREAGRTPKGRF